MSLTSKKRHGHKITMVTAYDFPSAVHVARANIDVVLVGDSVAMVELGYDTTQPVSMDEMIHHCSTVRRGIDFANRSTPSNTNNEDPQTQEPLLVGDMPFGSYEFKNVDVALTNAYRFVQEARVDAVKLEGGSTQRATTAKHIVQGGVSVMGHVGLTPQAISVLGGFRAQGRTAVRARQLLDEALRLQDAGVFSIVLECVPDHVADTITQALEIPTIGIGAGRYTTGQVLVFHDMLGMLSHPHHEQFVPKFCRKYAQVGHIIQEGLQEFRRDVRSGNFPGQEFSPYTMNQEEKQAFDDMVLKDREEIERKHQEAAAKYDQTDEYEKLQLYGSTQENKGENQ